MSEYRTFVAKFNNGNEFIAGTQALPTDLFTEEMASSVIRADLEDRKLITPDWELTNTFSVPFYEPFPLDRVRGNK